MGNYGKVFLWGLAISALGSLPLGTLNVTAMQVAISDGIPKAIQFSLGVAIIEVVYVRITLIGIHWLRQHALLLKWMDWIAFLMVIALAIGSFSAAIHPSVSKSFILKTNLPFFILGLVMSGLNPVQLPFWLGWSSFLFSKQVLRAKSVYYNWYMAGIGVGTLGGLAVFVFAGKLLVAALNANKSIINYTIGTVFLLTACIQLVKIIKHKGLAENTNIKGAELEIKTQETA